jgi:asparagine synthase (glutamine-hydrolysing)
MSQLVGLLSRRGEDIMPRLLKLLKQQAWVRPDAYGWATPSGGEHTPGPPEFTSLRDSAAIGYKLIKTSPIDNPQPNLNAGHANAYIGRLWESADPLTVFDTLRDDPRRGFEELLTERDGSLAAVVVEEGKITCARDTIGAVPLYCGQNNEHAAVASNIKTLIALDVMPTRVPPGHIVTLSSREIKDETITTLDNPVTSPLDLEEATDELDRLLTRAATRTSSGQTTPTLAFSGGIDSTLLAHYLKRVGLHLRLTCVGSPESPDLEAAEVAADSLGLPLTIKTYNETDLDEHLDNILLSVEEADPMKVGVATPLYFVAGEAARRSSRVLFSGNGSDELFGGYAKYVEEYQSDEKKAVASMFRDVTRSHEVNLERDWKVCSDLGLELRLPFIDPQLTRFALSLPPRYKLPKEGKEPRKIILRHLANRLGLPRAVSERPKKAAQYSSGTGKMIERLAKRNGKSVKGFLSDRLKEAIRQIEQG